MKLGHNKTMEDMKESHNRLDVEDEHDVHGQELMQVPKLRAAVLGQAWHESCEQNSCRFLAYLLLSGRCQDQQVPPTSFHGWVGGDPVLKPGRPFIGPI